MSQQLLARVVIDSAGTKPRRADARLEPASSVRIRLGP